MSKNRCGKCGKIYKTKICLHLHEQSNCGAAKQFECNICSNKFLSMGNLRTHQLCHTKEKSFICEYCDKAFLFKQQLARHRRMHTGVKPHECKECGKCFAHAQSLVTHYTIHTGIRPYMCSCCGSTFSCCGNLLKHQKSRKSTCGLSKYNTYKKLAKTSNQYITMKKPVYMDSSQKDEENLLEEYLMNDVNIEESQKCTKESSNRKTNFTLTQNEQFEEESLEIQNLDSEASDDLLDGLPYQLGNYQIIKKSNDIYEVQLMNQDEVNLGKLNSNEDETLTKLNGIQYSQNDRDFDHNILDSQFLSKDDDPTDIFDLLTEKVPILENETFELDIKTVKEDNISPIEKSSLEDDKQFKCEECGKVLASSSSLKNHLMIHSDEMPFNCSHCDKRFRTLGHFKVHQRTHTKEKPFQCEICGKSFPYRESIIVHMSKHTGNKRYKCYGCNEMFTCISNLRSHRRSRNHTCGQTKIVTKPNKQNFHMGVQKGKFKIKMLNGTNN